MKIEIIGYISNKWSSNSQTSHNGNKIWPTMLKTKNNVKYLSNSIATWNSKDGEGKNVYKYINFTVWKPYLMETFITYTKKDSYVKIIGFLKLTDNDKRTYLDVNVSNMEIIPPKKDSDKNSSQFSSAASPVEKSETTVPQDNMGGLDNDE